MNMRMSVAFHVPSLPFEIVNSVAPKACRTAKAAMPAYSAEMALASAWTFASNAFAVAKAVGYALMKSEIYSTRLKLIHGKIEKQTKAATVE